MAEYIVQRGTTTHEFEALKMATKDGLTIFYGQGDIVVASWQTNSITGVEEKGKVTTTKRSDPPIRMGGV